MCARCDECSAFSVTIKRWEKSLISSNISKFKLRVQKGRTARLSIALNINALVQVGFAAIESLVFAAMPFCPGADRFAADFDVNAC